MKLYDVYELFSANIFNWLEQSFDNIFEGITMLLAVIIPLVFIACFLACIFFGIILLVYYIATKKTILDLLENEKRYKNMWRIIFLISIIISIIILSFI